MSNFNMYKTMRDIHRIVGFFFIGIMAIYAFTGTTLIFRSQNFLKQKVEMPATTIDKGLTGDDLNEILEIKRFKVLKEDDKTVEFTGGTYDKTTGELQQYQMVYPKAIDKMVNFHKIVASAKGGWIGAVSGIALLILVITSFWMYKPSSKQFRNSMLIALAGVIFAILTVVLI